MANQSNEELLAARVKELEEQLSRKEDETAKQVAAVHESYRAGARKPLAVTPGTVTLALVPKGGGKAKKGTYKIADGYPKVRVGIYDIVQSAVLIKLAGTGEISEEELAANPGLKDWDQAKAVEFLNQHLAMGVTWLEEA